MTSSDDTGPWGDTKVEGRKWTTMVRRWSYLLELNSSLNEKIGPLVSSVCVIALSIIVFKSNNIKSQLNV